MENRKTELSLREAVHHVLGEYHTDQEPDKNVILAPLDGNTPFITNIGFLTDNRSGIDIDKTIVSDIQGCLDDDGTFRWTFHVKALIFCDKAKEPVEKKFSVTVMSSYTLDLWAENEDEIRRRVDRDEALKDRIFNSFRYANGIEITDISADDNT